MDVNATVYTKTAKGVTALKNGEREIKGLLTALALVDGRSTLEQLGQGLVAEARNRLQNDLGVLLRQGYVREVAGAAADVRSEAGSGLSDALEFDGVLRAAVEVTEHGPEEGVRVWAQARRGARELESKGFYTTGVHPMRARSGSGGRLRAVIVEDTESIAQLIAAYLGKRGFDTVIVADGREAIDWFDSGEIPDLALLDVNLPGADGFQILEHLRSKPQLADMPAIMVTARVSEDDVLRGIKGGADGYIFKPFDWRALYDCICSVMTLDDAPT